MKSNKFLKIILSILVIYSILGFLVIPFFLKSKLVEIINDNITKQASLEKLRFNPFTFKITLKNFTLKDDKEVIISFDKLYIDFSLFKSIDKKHIRFSYIELENPVINIIENENSKINLNSIIKSNTSSKKEKNQTQTSNMINFLISKTELENATINYKKISKKEPFHIQFKNLNYIFYDLGSFKNMTASQNLHTLINNDTLLEMKGGFRIVPLEFYGNVSLKRLKPYEILPFKKSMLNFQINKNANINLDFGYQVSLDKQLDIKVNKLNLDVNNININQNKKSLVKLKNFNIKNLNILYPKQKVSINTINLDDFYADIIFDENNNLNLLTLINEQKRQETKINKNEDSKPWDINIKNININKTNISYNNKISKDNINVKDLSILSNNVALKNNDLFLDKLEINEPKIAYTNTKTFLNTKVTNLKISAKDISKEKKKLLIKQIHLNKELLAIIDEKKNHIQTKNLDITVSNLGFNNNKLSLERTVVKNPYVGITLAKIDQKKQLKKDEEKPKIKEDKKSSNSIIFDFGPMNISNANLYFEDKNLPIPFKTLISKLNGEFSELNSSNLKPATFKVEGKVDKYGYTKITGLVNEKNLKELTDINMIFKNLTIKNFSAYSGKFVGREIEKGKLNLDLKYNIKKSNLDAQNRIIISNIKLGKEVKSKDATSLPLELAIALLEDPNGIIDLDIPITGNVDDPKFAITPIVWQAFKNIIIKAVSSPFNLLASLLGIEAEKIKSIEFAFGNSKLLPSELETLDNIAKIMKKRPNIAIKINSTISAEDINKLKEFKTDELIKEKMKKINEKQNYLLAIEELYSSYKNNENIDKIKHRFTNDKNNLEKTKYLQYLKGIITTKQEVLPEQLQELKEQRNQNIINYIVTTKEISKNRVIIIDNKTIENSKTKYTNFKLEVGLPK
ncbi:hypothetical protein CRV00_01390 [Malaciobacter molluscorum]|uniref:DUF748 domain-containing protein n=1 Tax=Malaciobacter molluscorum TaxID=1032072 RepID=UPI00100A96AA|nr:DUF748 domain-containing protein [Malaciobacter molluscorum]RXJ96302.1 hypothetical protein CRV00_01390 [Malaciobacter molluscorum]